MNRHAALSALIFTVLLTGCEYLDWSDEGRVNRAIPIPDDAAYGIEALLKQAPAERRASIEAEWERRLRLRALECSKGYSIDWFASSEEIRDALGDRPCFRDTDQALSRWLGYIRVGLVLTEAPLKSIPDTPPKFLIGDGAVRWGWFPETSGVAALVTDKSVQFVDLSNGRTLYTRPKDDLQFGSISPNGRLYTTGSRASTSIRNAESGYVEVEIPNVHTHNFHWLGDGAALYVTSNSSKLHLIDFVSGRDEPVTVLERHISRVYPTRSNSEFVVGTHRSISKFAVQRREGELAIVLVDEKTDVDGGWSINTSGRTSDGGMVFNARRELYLTSMETLEQETVSLRPYHVQTAVATPDPDQLILTGYVEGLAGRKPSPLVYSIRERTVRAIHIDQLPSARFVYAPALRRLGVIERSKVHLLEQLPLGEPVSLEQFVANANMEVNEAKLARLDLLSSSGSSSSISADKDRAGVESVAAPLARFVGEGMVEAIGVYESGGVGARPAGTHPMGDIVIRVRRSAKPLTLVLSSYEPVRWKLVREPGAKLAVVLVSSYYPSEVQGAGSARVLVMGRTSAYQRNSPKFNELDKEVYRQTGKRIGVFQGTYKGAQFSVGGA